MNSYIPFITEPATLARLSGQRFVVLRPGGPLPAAFRRVQDPVKQHLKGASASFPTEPHVTLAGFAVGTKLDELSDVVTAWARTVAPLHLEVERVSAFPAPFQILVVQIQKTVELFHTLSSLRDSAAQRNLALTTVMPAAKWIFHMTLATCPDLPSAAWQEACEFAEGLDPTAGVASTVHEAEIVVFDGGAERSGGIVPFKRGLLDVAVGAV